MRRRVILSLVLAAGLVLLQLAAGNGWGVALPTGVVGAVVAYLVLLVSDRWFSRRG